MKSQNFFSLLIAALPISSLAAQSPTISPSVPAPIPNTEFMPETNNEPMGENQRKQLSELLLKIGLCNEEYYGKEFCSNMSSKTETAPAETPPAVAPTASPSVIPNPNAAEPENTTPAPHP